MEISSRAAFSYTRAATIDRGIYGRISALLTKLAAGEFSSEEEEEQIETRESATVESIWQAMEVSEQKGQYTLAQSRGKLHPDLMGEVEFMLTQVPGEAMRNEQLQRLAQILIRGPQSTEELLEQSGQPPENVSAFLNACYTSGKLLVNRTSKTAVSF